MSDKIVIGTGKKRDKKDTELDLHRAHNHQTPAEVVEQPTVLIPLDENVWGNDYTIIKKLDEKQLAERRLYVRVRYMRRVECRAIFDSIEEEPLLLTNPIALMISDLSMGGIGIICDHAINIGKILVIPIILDQIPYEIKCEVIYCFQNENIFKAGLKIVQRDKGFIKHLKIYVARISLTSNYGQT